LQIIIQNHPVLKIWEAERIRTEEKAKENKEGEGRRIWKDRRKPGGAVHCDLMNSAIPFTLAGTINR
jgi:hypothetical protein